MYACVIQQWDKSASLNFGKTPVYFNSSVISIKTPCLESDSSLFSINADSKINNKHA